MQYFLDYLYFSSSPPLTALVKGFDGNITVAYRGCYDGCRFSGDISARV